MRLTYIWAMAWINQKIRLSSISLLFVLLAVNTHGQDTLPDFNAYIRTGKKVQLNWVNTFGSRVRQLSIQRSRDSLRLFKTIFTLPDPSIHRNGYIDQKLPDQDFYYRLYILLDSGRYIFSNPRKPIRELPVAAVKATPAAPPEKPVEPVKKPQAGVKPPRPEISAPEIRQPGPTPKPIEPEKKIVPPPPPPERTYIIKKADSVLGNLPESGLKKFRDSINLKTRDTIATIKTDTIYIRPFIPKEVFKLSKLIFMDKSGVLHLELPEAGRKNYRVKFFEEDKTPLFELKDIRDPLLLLDKANFQHAGWFLFEIYEADILIEKNRFFISRDF